MRLNSKWSCDNKTLVLNTQRKVKCGKLFATILLLKKESYLKKIITDRRKKDLNKNCLQKRGEKKKKRKQSIEPLNISLRSHPSQEVQFCEGGRGKKATGNEYRLEMSFGAKRNRAVYPRRKKTSSLWTRDADRRWKTTRRHCLHRSNVSSSSPVNPLSPPPLLPPSLSLFVSLSRPRPRERFLPSLLSQLVSRIIMLSRCYYRLLIFRIALKRKKKRCWSSSGFPSDGKFFPLIYHFFGMKYYEKRYCSYLVIRIRESCFLLIELCLRFDYNCIAPIKASSFCKILMFSWDMSNPWEKKNW